MLVLNDQTVPDDRITTLKLVKGSTSYFLGSFIISIYSILLNSSGKFDILAPIVSNEVPMKYFDKSVEDLTYLLPNRKSYKF